MKRETAYAKINLALHVRERLPNGYHRIETIFAFCEEGDELGAEPSDRLSLEIGGPFGEPFKVKLKVVILPAGPTAD